MKRAVLWSSIALPVLVAGLLACGPQKEPKQASAPDPTEEGTTGEGSGSGGSSASSKSSGSNGSAGSGGDNILVPPAGGAKPEKAAKGEAPNVANLATFQEGLRWGMSHAEVTKFYTETGGVISKDYDERLAKARVGPEMTALEAEREQQKAAFGRSYIEFKDTPTGYDATGIRGEYTYRNKESLMWISRAGKKRYLFFIGDRLWKIYDEVPLGDGAPLGKTFLEAVNKTNATLGAQGRVQGADAAKGINATTVDWKDGKTHLRLVDRSSEHLVAVVVEDQSTLNNIAALRPNKAEDPTAIDPSIAAVTKGGLSDPNAPNPSASASGGKKGAPPPKKK
jgi:hypothetical protein